MDLPEPISSVEGSSVSESRTHQATAGTLTTTRSKPHKYDVRPTQKSVVQHPPIFEEDKPAYQPLVIPDVNLQSLLLSDSGREQPDPFAEFAHVNYLAANHQGIVVSSPSSSSPAFPHTNKVLLSSNNTSGNTSNSGIIRPDRLAMGGAKIVNNNNGTLGRISSTPASSSSSISSSSLSTSSFPSTSTTTSSRSRTTHAPQGKTPTSLNFAITNTKPSTLTTTPLAANALTTTSLTATTLTHNAPTINTQRGTSPQRSGGASGKGNANGNGNGNSNVANTLTHTSISSNSESARASTTIIPAVTHAYSQSIAALAEPLPENAFIKSMGNGIGFDKDSTGIGTGSRVGRPPSSSSSSSSSITSDNNSRSGNTNTNTNSSNTHISPSSTTGTTTSIGTSVSHSNTSNSSIPSQVELRHFTTKIASMPQPVLMGTCLQVYQQLHNLQHKYAYQQQELERMKVECVALRRITGNTGKNNPEIVKLKEEKGTLCEIIESLKEKVDILEKAGVRMHWELEIQKQKKTILELTAKVEQLSDYQRLCTQLEHDKEGLNITLKSLHQRVDIQKSEISLLTQKNMELETQHVHCGPMIHQLQSQVAVLKNTQQILQENRASLLQEHHAARAMIHTQLQTVGTLERQLRDADVSVHQQLQLLREENSHLEQEVSSILAEKTSLQQQLQQSEEKRQQLTEELHQVIHVSRSVTVSHLSDTRKIAALVQETDALKEARAQAMLLSEQLDGKLQETRKMTSALSEQLSQCRARVLELEGQLDVSLAALSGFVYRERDARRQIKTLLLAVMRHSLESEAVHIVRNAYVSRILSYAVNELSEDSSGGGGGGNGNGGGSGGGGGGNGHEQQELFEALWKDVELTDRLGLTALHNGTAVNGVAGMGTGTGTRSRVRSSAGTGVGGCVGVLQVPVDDSSPHVLLYTQEERVDMVKQREHMLLQLLKKRRVTLKTRAAKLAKAGRAHAELDMLRGLLRGPDAKTTRTRTHARIQETEKRGMGEPGKVHNPDSVVDSEERVTLERTYGDLTVLFHDSDSDDDLIEVDTDAPGRARKRTSGKSASGKGASGGKSSGKKSSGKSVSGKNTFRNSGYSEDPEDGEGDGEEEADEEEDEEGDKTSISSPSTHSSALTTTSHTNNNNNNTTLTTATTASSAVSLRGLCRRALQHFCAQWKGDAATQTPSQAQSDITTASSAVSLVLNWTERLHSVTRASSAVAIGRLLMHYSSQALAQLRADLGVGAATLPLEGFATITHVVAGRPAALAGLSVGTVVWSVDGVRVRGKEDLFRAVWGKRPGDVVTITVVQDGMRIVADVAAEYGEEHSFLDSPHAGTGISASGKSPFPNSGTGQGKGVWEDNKSGVRDAGNSTSTGTGTGTGSYIKHSLTSLELPSQSLFVCRRAQARALKEQVSQQRLYSYKVTLAAEGVSHAGLDKLTALSNGIVYHRDVYRYQRAYREKQRRLLNGVVCTDVDIIYGESSLHHTRQMSSQGHEDNTASTGVLTSGGGSGGGSDVGGKGAWEGVVGHVTSPGGPVDHGDNDTGDEHTSTGTGTGATTATTSTGTGAAVGLEHACVEVGVRTAWGNLWLKGKDGSDECDRRSYVKDNQVVIALHNVRSVDALKSLCQRVFPSKKPGGPPVIPRNYSVDENADIYLGGSCDPTTWRQDISMPLCELHGVSYYNPQVDDWRPELVAIEAKAKEEASLLFFVIDNATRAIGSMLEAAEYIGRGRRVVLVIQEMEQDQPVHVGKDLLPASEVKDLTRARRFLKDVAQRAGVPCYSGADAIVLAMQDAIARCNGRVEMTAATQHDATMERLQHLAEHILKQATINVLKPSHQL